jgi:hypothetical protein
VNEGEGLALYLVKNGELKDCTLQEIYDIAAELGIDVGFYTKEHAIRKIEREVKRADSIKKSHEFIGPWLWCEVPGCEWNSITAEGFERHEIAPNVWRWVCKLDVETLELNEGK